MSGEMARANADAVARALALNAHTLSLLEDAYFEQGQVRPVLEQRRDQLDSGAVDGEIAATAPAALAQMMGGQQEVPNG